MSLPLRINYQNRDYTYTILTKNIGKDTKTITIILQGEEFTLIKNEKAAWEILGDNLKKQLGLVNAISRSLILRYRL